MRHHQKTMFLKLLALASQALKAFFI